MSQIDVTSIVNKITFKVDNASYKRALMAIRKVGSEWAKVQGKISSAISAGRRIAGTSGSMGGGSRSQFVGPMPFSPGTNTKMQQREAKKAAQEQARIARQTEAATKKHNDTLRKLREIDARRQESEAKRQEQFKNKIAGQFMGPMPSRDMVNARRESIRNQRNEANRSARAQETISAGNIRRTSMFGGAGNAAMGSQIASLNAQLKSGAISLQVYRQSVAALERDFKRASVGGRDFLGTLREVRSAFVALTAANLAFTGGAAIMVSTPSGLDAVFYKTFMGARELDENGNSKNGFKAVELWWYNDPRYNKDLVWVKNKGKENEIRIPDENWDNNRRIQMANDGWEASSPWYEKQVRNANGDMRKIAQELLCINFDSLVTIRNKTTGFVETIRICDLYSKLNEQNNSCEYL